MTDRTMLNQSMRMKLRKEEAVDLSACERTDRGDYLVPGFAEDVDYCDAKTEEWIWSIARLTRPMSCRMANGDERVLPTGTYLASTTAKYYNPDADPVAFECVWLR